LILYLFGIFVGQRIGWGSGFPILMGKRYMSRNEKNKTTKENKRN
jgi:hypothetical protein